MKNWLIPKKNIVICIQVFVMDTEDKKDSLNFIYIIKVV